MVNKGKIILLNGASSAGKSSIASEIQRQIEHPFWHVSSDQLIAAKILPPRDFEGGRFAWKSMRENFFGGFHNCLPALARAGNNLVVDHVIEFETWLKDLNVLLADFDLFFVGVHCDIGELERREIARKDRTIGEARDHFEVVHTFCHYDYEVDSTILTPAVNARNIIHAWKKRNRGSIL